MSPTRLVVLAGVLSLTAVACGGSSASKSTSPSTAPGTAPATTIVATTSAGTGALGSAAPGSAAPGASTSSIPAPTKSILELATEEGSLTTMLKLLDTAGMTATLQGKGPFTLVAPTDAAFRKMDPDTLAKISASPTVLKQLLSYHLVNGRVTNNDVTAGFATSAEGTTIALQTTKKLPTLNGLIIRKAGRATNGTILVVDSVMIPVDIKLP